MIVNTNDNRTNSEYNKKCINCIWHKRYDAWNIWCVCTKENGEKLYEDRDNRFGNSTVKNECKYYKAIGSEVNISKRTNTKANSTNEEKKTYSIKDIKIASKRYKIDVTKKLLKDFEAENDPDNDYFIKTLKEDLANTEKELEELERA